MDLRTASQVEQKPKDKQMSHMTSQTPLAGSVRKDEIFLEVGTVAAKSKITKATSGHTTERFGKS